MSGYNDGTVKPGEAITRAEFAKLIVRANDWTLVIPAKPSFKDVNMGFWAYAYVETAKARGVITGYPDGTFRPEAPVRRAEVASMLVRTEGYQINIIGGKIFLDVPPEHWAFQSIMTARNVALIEGYPGNVFKPENRTSRAEAAKLIFNTLPQ